MTSIARLVTWVDIDERRGSDPPGLTFSARLDAVLDDGRRVVLLDDRGWTQSIMRLGGVEANIEDYPPDWSLMREDVERDARGVVGPDPLVGVEPRELWKAHWAWIAEALEREGVEVEPSRLSAIPHDVEFSDRLRARVRDS